MCFYCTHGVIFISISFDLDIVEQAKKWSPEMISQFLRENGKNEHAKTFLEEEIDGVELLNASRDVYKELGVTSSTEYAQIAILFKRQLMGVEVIYCSLSELIDKNKKLVKHLEALQKSGVNADMLKFAEQNNFFLELLEDIGIKKQVEINRLQSAVKYL